MNGPLLLDCRVPRYCTAHATCPVLLADALTKIRGVLTRASDNARPGAGPRSPREAASGLLAAELPLDFRLGTLGSDSWKSACLSGQDARSASSGSAPGNSAPTGAR